MPRIAQLQYQDHNQGDEAAPRRCQKESDERQQQTAASEGAFPPIMSEGKCNDDGQNRYRRG